MGLRIAFTKIETEGVRKMTWSYTVSGSLIPDEIASFVLLLTPPRYGFWVRDWPAKNLSEIGGGVWNVTVPYSVGPYLLTDLGRLGTSGNSKPSNPGKDDPLGREWSFDYSSSTKKVLKSIECFGGQRLATGAEGGLTKPLPAKAGGMPIGYNPATGEVTGADITPGDLRWELSFKVPFVTFDYQNLLESLKDCADSEAFMNREAGEVQFAGGRIASKDADGSTVNLNFTVKKNQTNVKVGDILLVPSIEGWDYLDIIYQPFLNPDGPAGATIKLPERWLTQRVVPRADLNQLLS